MNQATVLIYNLYGERADQVAGLANSLGITPYMVNKSEYSQKLGALCGISPRSAEEYKGDGFEEELLLLAFFPKGRLNLFLDGFRELGIQTVALKAMLTENNSVWDSLALHGELLQEYETIRNMQARQGKK
jgi:hypothetical protein